MKRLLFASILMNIIILSTTLATIRPYAYVDNAELVITSKYQLNAWTSGYEAGARRVAGAAANYINDMEDDKAINDLLMLISIHFDMDEYSANEYITAHIK